MGLFSDILEANRERGYSGYVDSCMIMSSLEGNNQRFSDYRVQLNQYKESESNTMLKVKMQQDFWQKSCELERLKAGYLIAEKIIFEMINCEKIQSVYMKDMLDTLQFQLCNAYRAICKLRFEIDQKFNFKQIPNFRPNREEDIRIDVLNKIIHTTLHHMEVGSFADTSSFRKVVSDCAEIIKYMKNEHYRMSNKKVFSYYLMETVGLKATQHKCCNCGRPLLSHIGYCLNCYERNI